ncbi:hypothetical protein [Gymnodinialimonas ulvae]|uniref:hypothetical protein n=1 Tax=Gymnodinialimonas ulvae TaxID=3126504 RepID=UPI0030EBFED8
MLQDNRMVMFCYVSTEDHLITTPTGRLVWRRGHWAWVPAPLDRSNAAIRDLFDKART